MAEKVQLGKVEIPPAQQKWFRYVAKDGSVFAVEPKRNKLTDEEKASRLSERKAKRAKVVAQNKKFRNAMLLAKNAARKNPSVGNAKAFEQALLAYEDQMRKKK